MKAMCSETIFKVCQKKFKKRYNTNFMAIELRLLSNTMRPTHPDNFFFDFPYYIYKKRNIFLVISMLPPASYINLITYIYGKFILNYFSSSLQKKVKNGR